jgi:LmbE family N-acetylglucosaminyl deacetylase
MNELHRGKSVLVFAAHPDDTEIFVSGTLKLLKDNGHSITICTMTAGGMGGIGTNEHKTIRIRKAEARNAAEKLEAPYHCLDGRDGYLYDTEALRIKANRLIRAVAADIVITHLPMDYHADHRACASIAESAALLSTLPNVPCGAAPLAATPALYHCGTLGLSDPLGNSLPEPHFYVDIGSVEEFKTSMLSCHISQIDLMRVMHKVDDFSGAMKSQDMAWGKLSGCEYAEAYWQHLGGGFPKLPLIQDALRHYVTTRSPS